MSDAPSFFLRLNDQQYKSNGECDFIFDHEKLVRTAHFFFFSIDQLNQFFGGDEIDETKRNENKARKKNETQ